MERHDDNRGGSEPMAGAANTPPFGAEPRAGGSAGDASSRSEAGGAGDAPRTETERELERTRDMMAESAAPVIAEKAQETIAAAADRLRHDPELKEQVRRTASAAQHDAQRMVGEKADEMRNRVEERINQGMQQAAGRLEDVAQRIDQVADQQMGGDSGPRARAGQMAHTVADTMESVAGYLRNHDAQGLRGDLERQVRDRPLETLLMGVAAGWIVGKILR